MEQSKPKNVYQTITFVIVHTNGLCNISNIMVLFLCSNLITLIDNQNISAFEVVLRDRITSM